MCSFSRFAVILAGVAFGGCSEPVAFYVVPEHQELGIIEDRSRVATAEFVIVNGLNQPVRIKHIYPSCNCAAVELRDNPIPAGESTMLRVAATLSEQPGNQEVSILLVTDSSAFPRKRVSFAATVPASGTRRRRVPIGSFYPGDQIDITMPATSLSRGVVHHLEAARGNSDIAAELVPDPDWGKRLAVSGAAPQAVGEFSSKLELRESFPDEPELGEGIVELELTGTVVPRWNVRPHLYAGFVSLSEHDGMMSLHIEANTIATGPRAPVARIYANNHEEWLSLRHYSARSDRIELIFEISGDKLQDLGAVEAAVDLAIKYDDGSEDRYSTSLFAYIEP